MFKTVIPEWSSEEVEKTVTPILNEYFEHAQMREVLVSLLDFLHLSQMLPLYRVFVLGIFKRSQHSGT